MSKRYNEIANYLSSKLDEDNINNQVFNSSDEATIRIYDNGPSEPFLFADAPEIVVNQHGVDIKICLSYKEGILFQKSKVENKVKSIANYAERQCGLSNVFFIIGGGYINFEGEIFNDFNNGFADGFRLCTYSGREDYFESYLQLAALSWFPVIKKYLNLTTTIISELYNSSLR